MNALELLTRLRRAQVQLRAEGDKLVITAAAAALDADLRAALAAHKAELIDVLRRLQGGSAAPEPALARAPDDAPLSASFGQERLWFLQELTPDSAAYNMACAIDLRGPLSPAALERALIAVVDRHQPLHTRLAIHQGDVVAVREPATPRHLLVTDLSRLAFEERRPLAQRIVEAEARRPFRLAAESPLRAQLVAIDPLHHVLGLTVHHGAFDGESWRILLRDVAALYAAALEQRAPELPSLPVSYADYARWERRRADAAVAQLQEWTRRMAPLPPPLALFGHLPTRAVEQRSGAELARQLPRELASRLRRLARDQEIAAYVVLLAGFVVLLHRLAHQDELVVGMPVSTRSRREFDDMVGFFVNTLPLRIALDGAASLRTVLARVRDEVVAALSRQDVPFERILQALGPARSSLFQAMFAVQNDSPPAALELPGVAAKISPIDTLTAKFDLSLYVRDQGDEIGVTLEYDTARCSPAAADALLQRYEVVLAQLIANPEARTGGICLLSPEERDRVIVEWNAPATPPPRRLTIHAMFDDQARATPEATAIVWGRDEVSYEALRLQANGIAHRLRASGIGRGSLVGLCLRRTPQMVAAMLGVLKSGAAWVPLDTSHPRDRLAQVVADSALEIVITDRDSSDHLPSTRGALFVDGEALVPRTSPPADRSTPEDLAYVIYTSGSTGTPKGVAIEHGSATALLAWAREALSASETAAILAATPITFDLSIFELFVPLVGGGRVVLADNIHAVARSPHGDGVTLVNTVPSVLAEFMRAESLPRSVKTVVLAGEALPGVLVEQLRAAGVSRVINAYAPTETTTYSTAGEPLPGRPPDIGRPLPHERVYLLDGELHPVAPGDVGEIFIGGIGVARGYLRRPELTAERFLPDPFHGGRMFRTGDFGRHLPDGRIEFLGRRDLQVKLRGVRMELEEIEGALSRCPGIRESAVAVIDDKVRGFYLCGYVVPVGPSPSATALRAALRARLPGPMVPARFVTLDALPRLPNGKLDRHALRPPTGDRDGVFVAPRNEAEQLLASAFRDVLGIERVSVADDFFELGGHSLSAMRLMARIWHIFCVQLPLRAIFEQPTIEGLCAVIDRARWLASGDEPVGSERMRVDL